MLLEADKTANWLRGLLEPVAYSPDVVFFSSK